MATYSSIYLVKEMPDFLAFKVHLEESLPSLREEVQRSSWRGYYEEELEALVGVVQGSATMPELLAALGDGTLVEVVPGVWILRASRHADTSSTCVWDLAGEWSKRALCNASLKRITQVYY